MTTEATTMDEFTDAYACTALWSSVDEDGEPLDYHGTDSLAPSTVRAMREDCDGFRSLLEEQLSLTDATAECAQDFWLTRNRHGTGFWDGSWEDASKLTEIAHSFGSADLYLGDDGLIYQMGSENA